MKKFFTLFITLLLFTSVSVAANTADQGEISVETPVKMTFVSESDGNYEYNVAVNAAVTENGAVAKDKKVSILMFGNRDNTAFVSGNNVLSLTADEIVADYYVYYVDQTVSGNDGRATFDFNITLPSPAKTDAYYVWVGAENSEGAQKLSADKLSISTQIVAVTLVAGSNEAIEGESIALTPDAVNVFGNSVPDAVYSYSVKQNDSPTEASVWDNILSTFGLSGIYNITVTATATDGTAVTSDGITLSVDGTTLLGDLDGNKRINLPDVIAVLKHVAGISSIESGTVNVGDINRNGSIDIQDALSLLKYIARIIIRF